MIAGTGIELRFFTKEECEEWLLGRERPKPDVVPDIQVERIAYPTEARGIFGMVHWIANSLTYRMPTLLWITEWSVWPSSENWHLYYKLRHSYGDLRLLHEGPGHLFLEHEPRRSRNLASFRPCITTMPLRFAITSPPSGWEEDFHLQAVEHVLLGPTGPQNLMKISKSRAQYPNLERRGRPSIGEVEALNMSDPERA